MYFPSPLITLCSRGCPAAPVRSAVVLAGRLPPHVLHIQRLGSAALPTPMVQPGGQLACGARQHLPCVTQRPVPYSENQELYPAPPLPSPSLTPTLCVTSYAVRQNTHNIHSVLYKDLTVLGKTSVPVVLCYFHIVKYKTL